MELQFHSPCHVCHLRGLLGETDGFVVPLTKWFLNEAKRGRLIGM